MMWGTSWRQRLRLLPLDAAMALGDRLAALAPAARVPAAGAWQPGITVLVPDRDAPQMLAEALASLREALARCDEPAQVIVVANGAPLATYDALRARFREVEWVHEDRPLGFAGAVERGLAQARHDATFLMNNDMTLDAGALASLLRTGRRTCSRSGRRSCSRMRRAAAKKRASPTGMPTSRVCTSITHHRPMPTARSRTSARAAAPRCSVRRRCAVPCAKPRLRPLLLGGRRVESAGVA